MSPGPPRALPTVAAVLPAADGCLGAGTWSVHEARRKARGSAARETLWDDREVQILDGGRDPLEKW